MSLDARPAASHIDHPLMGLNQNTILVAEAGINHNGSLEKAIELIHTASACGAHAIKFQTFRAQTFISDVQALCEYRTASGIVVEKSIDMFRRMELDYSSYARLFKEARQAGILLFSTPCDEEAVDLLDSLNAPAFKISSDYLTHHEFLKYLGAKGRPLILSTGMASLGDIEEALDAIYSSENHQVILLHCVSAYPTPCNQVNLKAMETLHRAFQCPVGFSDHTEGTAIPLAAAALGAVVIEKHFTLDKEDMHGPDHWFSADPDELRALADGIHKIGLALGSPMKQVASSEQQSRLRARMSLVAATDIPAGTIITRQMLNVKRPGTGIPPKEIETIVGQVALQNFTRNQVMHFHQIGKMPTPSERSASR